MCATRVFLSATINPHNSATILSTYQVSGEYVALECKVSVTVDTENHLQQLP
jgi:hypothetical protein